MDGDDDPHHRNVSSTCSDAFLEKLISEVKKYPCLYAIHSLQYRDVAAKERSWNEISKQSNRHSSGLKKEWKKLRDCYRQALVTRIRNDSKKKNLRPWKFEKQMEFLKPYITPRSRHLDGGQTSSETEFDAQSNVTVKQDPTSDDDSPYMTEAGTSSSHAEDMPPTRLLRSQVRPPPSSSKPPRKRNKKEKSSTSSNDIPTEYSSASSTPTHASENDHNKPSTSSQNENPHVSYTCSSDMNVEEDNSQEPGPITTIDDSIQMTTSLAIVANILENCKVKPVTTALNNTLSTVTTTLTNNTLSTVNTTLTNNTLSTVATTLGNNNVPTVTTTFGNNTVSTFTTTIGNNLPTNTLPTSTLGGNTIPTTTIRDNTLPPDINTLETNSPRPPHINTLENNTMTSNSLPKNASVYGTNIHPTITYENGGRRKYSYPFSMLGNISQLQSNSALRNSNIPYPPTVGNFQNSNNSPSTSAGPLLNNNMQRIIHPYLNGFIDTTGQLHSFIIPIPLRSVGIDAKATSIKSDCKSSTGPPVAGNLDNKKLLKVGFSHFVDIIGKNNQCQLYKLTPKTTNTVSNNNIQQDNSMDTSISYNHDQKINSQSKSTSTGSSSYVPPFNDLNTNNGSTQTDSTFEDKNHPQSADSRSNSAHLPSTESMVGDINNVRIQLIGKDHLQSIRGFGNKKNTQSADSRSNSDNLPSEMDIGNDCLTFDRTLGNTSIQKFSVSTQTTSPTNNDRQEHGALQLFFSSMYESTKKLPINYQNTIKKDLFESVLSAEKKHHAY